MTKATLEERVDVMTNEQWDGMIKMVMLIVGRCKTTDKALNALKILLRNKEDAEAVFEELRAGDEDNH